ncbi:MAG: hypothetical protein GC129_04750 [Proteobacteria bacterium]|nr:hypothetical protein [Pseudomonadota bacterium]
MNGRTITRQELFKLVWEKPMLKLAKDFGISDVGLKKICKRLNIPTPPQGHWVRAELGKATTPPKLPQGAYPAEVRIIPQDKIKNPKSQSLADIKAREEAPANRIKVPATLIEPHPWIEQALKVANRNSNKPGIFSLAGAHSPDIHASAAQADRALRTFDTFLKALKARGLKVWIEHQRTWVCYEKEDLRVELKEVRTRRYLSKEEQAVFKPQYSWDRPPAFVDEPNGQLHFCIYETKEFYSSYVRVLKETPAQPMETRVNDMILVLARMAEATKLKRQERLQREAQWAEESKRREEREKLERERELRLKKFMEWQKAWEDAKRLASFTHQVEELVKDLPEEHEARRILKVAQEHSADVTAITTRSIREIKKPEYGHYLI